MEWSDPLLKCPPYPAMVSLWCSAAIESLLDQFRFQCCHLSGLELMDEDRPSAVLHSFDGRPLQRHKCVKGTPLKGDPPPKWTNKLFWLCLLGFIK